MIFCKYLVGSVFWVSSQLLGWGAGQEFATGVVIRSAAGHKMFIVYEGTVIGAFAN